MENREYFFHKRKSMAQRENDNLEDPIDSKFSKQFGQNHHQGRRFGMSDQRNQNNPFKGGGYQRSGRGSEYAKRPSGPEFFDKISTSCNEQEQQELARQQN